MTIAARIVWLPKVTTIHVLVVDAKAETAKFLFWLAIAIAQFLILLRQLKYAPWRVIT